MRSHRCLPLLLLFWVVATGPAARAEMITDLSAIPYTGSATSVHVALSTVTGESPYDAVKIELTVNGAAADLRGLFLNVVDESLLEGLTAWGDNVTSWLKEANAVSDLGGGVNSHPAGGFDIGIELGTPGLGTDDLSTATVFLSHASQALSVADFLATTEMTTEAGTRFLVLAVRVTSVEEEDGSRNGSSKLGAELLIGGPTSVVTRTPEPTALGLLALGGALALGWWRRPTTAARRGHA